jgi:subtilisin family serine protease/sugar lactone lactonase YvrE
MHNAESRPRNAASFARKLIGLLLVMTLWTGAAWGQQVKPVMIYGHEAHPTRILAKLRPGNAAMNRAAAMQVQGVSIKHQYRLIPGLVMFEGDAVQTTATSQPTAEDQAGALLARIKALKDSGQYEYVEPDYIVHATLTPNDASFANGILWGLQNTGQNFGVAGIDIDAVPAWNLTTGSTDVIVAVIDSGIWYTHQDLQAQMWVNPGETAGNGIDDDGDGYVDDVHGINAITGSGDPMDDAGHGTMCAGIIGAAANDGNSMVGVAWKVRLMACKFLDASGSGTISDEIKCIDYAVAKGARILNNSYGRDGDYSHAEYDAIAAAGQLGVLFVAAAGNDSANTDVAPHYPSCYALDNIISVAAIDRTGARASFSNFGSKTVHLGAPGVAIYSCSKGGDSSYDIEDGTSFAAPYVAGVATLVLAEFPSISGDDLRNRILNTTTPIGALQLTTATGGRVDAYQALTRNPTGALQLAASLGDNTSFVAGEPVAMYVHVTDLLGVTNATVTGTAPGLSPITFANNGVAPDRTANDAFYSAMIAAPIGDTQLAVTVTARAPGKTSTTKTFTYAVVRPTPPPANDSFANATPLTGTSVSVTGSNAYASKEPGEPDHAGTGGGRSVWWAWTAPSTGAVTISTSGSDFDTLLAVYTGTSVSALTSVASNNDVSRTDLTSQVSFYAIAGTAYAIAVDGSDGDTGDIQLALTEVSAVAPGFSSQPVSQTGQIGGTVSIQVAAGGAPQPILQWQVSRDAGNSWVDLSDGGLYSGVDQATLTIAGIPLLVSGSEYRCVASSGVGTAISDLATVLVTRANTVTTFAGSGKAGSDDGQNLGTVASFAGPYGVAVDTLGNIYVADTYNNKIRKISPSGVVTTLAGSGNAGSTDGTGPAASFSGPLGVAVDDSGNVYVTDAENNKIRKVNSAGAVTTLAGSGSDGSMDGTGTAASFDWPRGIAVDTSGSVYVADGNSTIRKISSTGVVTTLAGSGTAGSIDGPGTAASFFNPTGVAIDASGNIYVGDSNNNKIRMVSPTGLVTTLAGCGFGSADGLGSEASFCSPYGVAVDASGNVYVADGQNSEIRKVDSAGVVTTLAGSYIRGSADGTGSAASFNSLYGVAVDRSGYVYVADTSNNDIRKVSPAGVVTTLAGIGYNGSADGLCAGPSFHSPTGVAVDALNSVYVADASNNKIRKVESAGMVTTLAGSGTFGSTDGTGSAASFCNPNGVAVDASGNVYVADTWNNKVRTISPAGVITTIAGTGFQGSTDGAGTAAGFYYPMGVAVDGSGNVYVADTGNSKIREISPVGIVTTFAGSGNYGSTDGAGTAASFMSPRGVALDGAGNVYVADTGNNEIRKVSPAGVVTTLAGSSSNGSTDGTGKAASFWNPSGVAVDVLGNVYVADRGNNRIRKVNPAGVVTTVASSGNNFLPASAGTATSFADLSGIAIDAAGNVYVADAVYNKVWEIPLVPEVVPKITWGVPAAIVEGTALSSVQINATADVPGTFVYTPAAGTVLAAGTQTLSATFTPVDTTNFTSATATQTLTVVPSNPAEQAFLQQIYPLVLRRPVDPGVLAAMVAAMSGGRTRAEVYGELIGSAEYNAWQIEAAIRLYYAALARMPDYAGLQNWSNALHAGTLTLTGAADQFAASAEFVLKYGSLDNIGFVQQLYRNVLGREADPAGLNDWVGQLNAGATRGKILVGFSESNEFKGDMADQVEIVRLYYLLEQRMPTAAEMQSWIEFFDGDDQTETLLAQAHPSGLSDADYVQAVFQAFLCRPADAGALSNFTAGLAAGTVTHGSLVDTVLNSTEFGIYVAPVSRLYLAAFQRVPDQPGLVNWVNYARAGNSLQSMADTFTASQEFINRYGGSSDTDYVTQLYQNVLGRAPDPGGLAHWTGLLSGGATRGQVLTGFSESQEGMKLFAPTLRTFLIYNAFLNATPAQADLDYWTNYLATLTDQFRETFLDDIRAGG